MKKRFSEEQIVKILGQLTNQQSSPKQPKPKEGLKNLENTTPLEGMYSRAEECVECRQV